MGGYFGYIIVMIVGAAISGLVALWLRSTYAKYSKQMSNSGLTGAQTARMILDRNGLTNVRVEPIAGKLTDHYDPRSKVVRLSEANFSQPSIAGVSVAAHEVGHAIQDHGGYLPMKLRSGLVPIVNIGGQLWTPLFIMGIVMGASAGLGQIFIQLAVIAFAGVLLFHVVTLPVEINASTRAYGLLTNYGILSHTEASGTRRVLTAAAFTYIAAALTSLLTLLYLIMLSRD
ncbi:MAG: zinc metallopeptidase [Rubrobacteraceae bacterium]